VAASWIEEHKLKNTHVLWMNAKNIGFPDGSFDLAISGFMGWYDCFDFVHGEFTQQDMKSKEIWRQLRDGGRVVVCSWEGQEDLQWIEETFIKHFPPLATDREYLERHPIGWAGENAAGYCTIFSQAGFRDIQAIHEKAEFVSTDEEEWWEQMRNLGWASFFNRIEGEDADKFHRVKESVFQDLQRFKRADGIHFSKSVFFVSGVK
jgi:ubiquinone/menaquinone biosynthesis C-methylase UbiE